MAENILRRLVNNSQVAIDDGVYEITGNVRVRQYQEDVALKILQQISQVEDIGGNPQKDAT